MQWLSSWLKELIVIILLAAFVELLLPNQAFQRYVRTVIGLFLLTVLLSPLFQLFRRDWNAEELIREATIRQDQGAAIAVSGNAGAGGGNGMQSVESIMKDAERLSAENAKKARQLTEDQIEASIRTGLEERLGLTVRSVEVKLDEDKEGRVYAKEVAVRLSPDKPPPEPQQKGMKPVEPIATVKPVTVDIGGKGTGSGPTGETGTPEPREVSSESGTADTRAAADYIEREWQIPKAGIRISVEKTREAG